MKIFLVGSNGKTGQEILKKLLKMGYRVFALVRNPEDLAEFFNNRNINIVQGDVYQPKTYAYALYDSDCIVSALGAGFSMKKTDIYSKGGEELVLAMRKANIKRLITITSASNDPKDPASKGFIMRFFVRPLFRGTFNDMLQWERFLDRNKDIEWTCVRPRSLTNKNEEGRYRVQLDNCPANGSEISRKDLADFIVNLIHDRKYIHDKPAIAY